MLTDGLYRVDPKALKGQLLRWRNFTTGQTVANTLVTGALNPQLPRDNLFLLKTVGVRTAPGAGQRTESIEVRVLDVTGSVLAEITPALAMPGIASRNLVGSLNLEHLVFGGSTFDYSCRFDAGAVANFVQLTLSGWQLPRGNINY